MWRLFILYLEIFAARKLPEVYKFGPVVQKVCRTLIYSVIRLKEIFFFQRITSHDRAVLLVMLSSFAFFISTTAWLLWSALSAENAPQRRNHLYITCYALYGFMDIFCLGKCLSGVTSIKLRFSGFLAISGVTGVRPI